uniref:Uncharacterized protein n=1 Tax=Rhizophora mucronata TaxID=61149 RepID=A0A2P2IXG4_RHIMU
MCAFMLCKSLEPFYGFIWLRPLIILCAEYFLTNFLFCTCFALTY